MGIITLISDLGTRDHYVASVKAALLSQAPQSVVVDVSHHIRSFDIHEAAFMLRSVWLQFPLGTVHIIGVKPEYNAEQIHLVVQYLGHYFIGADNGIFSLLFDEMPEDIYEITLTQGTDWTFPMRGVFATCAAHLSRGGAPEFLGKRIDGLRQTPAKLPHVEKDSIKGHVQYIDHYGNIYSNITRELFDSVSEGRRAEVHFKRALFTIKSISNYYPDVVEGERVCMWASNGFLLIALNGGSNENGGGAADLFGLKKDDIIRIEFYGNTHSENDF